MCDKTSVSDKTAFTMVNTVAKNKKYLTLSEVKWGKHVRDHPIMIGRPSQQDFINIIKNQIIPYMPVTGNNPKMN